MLIYRWTHVQLIICLPQVLLSFTLFLPTVIRGFQLRACMLCLIAKLAVICFALWESVMLSLVHRLK